MNNHRKSVENYATISHPQQKSKFHARNASLPGGTVSKTLLAQNGMRVMDHLPPIQDNVVEK